jgi:hypothetical protein
MTRIADWLYDQGVHKDAKRYHNRRLSPPEPFWRLLTWQQSFDIASDLVDLDVHPRTYDELA